MTDRRYEKICKVVIVGDSCSGKSNLNLRITDDRFRDKHEATVGVELGTRILSDTPGQGVKLQILDTTGNESFRVITRSYLIRVNAIILTVDLTKSKDEATNIISNHMTYLNTHLDDGVPIILAGTKSDLRNDSGISDEEFANLAKENGFANSFITSAKNNTNVTEMFEFVGNNYAVKCEREPFLEYMEQNQIVKQKHTKREDERLKQWSNLSQTMGDDFDIAIALLEEYALIDPNDGKKANSITSFFLGHPARNHRDEVAKVLSNKDALDQNIDKLLGALKYELNEKTPNSEGALSAVFTAIFKNTNRKYDDPKIKSFNIEEHIASQKKQ